MCKLKETEDERKEETQKRRKAKQKLEQGHWQRTTEPLLPLLPAVLFSSLSSFLTALINTIRLAEISLWCLGRKGL